MTGLPFDDVRALISRMPSLASPVGGMGKGLFRLARWAAHCQQRHEAKFENPVVALYAGSHGVARHLPPPPMPLSDMVARYHTGEASLNTLCDAHSVGLKLFDLALEQPTADLTEDAALDERTCAGTFAFGMEAMANGADLLCVSSIETTSIPAIALAAALYGGAGTDWADDQTEAELIDRALGHHGDALAEPLDALRRVGGREIAAMAGAIIAARFQRCRVLIDGLAATVAAALLYRIEKAALDHCCFAQTLALRSHRQLLGELGQEPLLDLQCTESDGIGAVLAVPVLRGVLTVE